MDLLWSKENTEGTRNTDRLGGGDRLGLGVIAEGQKGVLIAPCMGTQRVLNSPMHCGKRLSSLFKGGRRLGGSGGQGMEGLGICAGKRNGGHSVRGPKTRLKATLQRSSRPNVCVNV